MEIRKLCLKQGQSLNARAAPPYPSICWVPTRDNDTIIQSKMNKITHLNNNWMIRANQVESLDEWKEKNQSKKTEK